MTLQSQITVILLKYYLPTHLLNRSRALCDRPEAQIFQTVPYM